MIPATSTARRTDAVLVVIDPQQRLAAAMEHRGSVLSSIERLVAVASLTGVPVVATRQYPRGLGDLEPPVLEALERVEAEGCSVGRVDKVAFDCFSEPAFAEHVAETARKQLILCGMETHICVAQTCLDALSQGYDVHVVADASCSRRSSDHRFALERMRAAGAVVTVHESVMYELVGAAGTDEFKALLSIVKG